MAKGGYQIVDFKSVNASSGEPISTPGVYETLEGNYGKATLVSGVVIAGKSYAEEYVAFTNAESNFIGKMSKGTTISVTQDDMTTFTTSE